MLSITGGLKMFNYILVIIVVASYLIYEYPRLFYYYLRRNKISIEKRLKYIHKVSRRLTSLAGIEYHIEGLENIPENETLVFTPNHQSALDILILGVIPQSTAPVAKIEVLKLPFFNLLAIVGDSILLDRKDLRSSYQTVIDIKNRLEAKRNIIVFLEGTRSKNKDYTLLEFKPGGLKPVYQSFATIVPVAIHGYFRVLDKTKKSYKSKVYISFMKPLRYQDYKDVNNIDLSARLQQQINDKVQELKNK
jgi:1-acyl-sn-glycerol-3-phosphate acyltransferase